MTPRATISRALSRNDVEIFEIEVITDGCRYVGELSGIEAPAVTA